MDHPLQPIAVAREELVQRPLLARGRGGSARSLQTRPSCRLLAGVEFGPPALSSDSAGAFSAPAHHQNTLEEPLLSFAAGTSFWATVRMVRFTFVRRGQFGVGVTPPSGTKVSQDASNFPSFRIGSHSDEG